MSNHDEVLEKVRAQQEKFNAELPELIKRHYGKWICYRDGVQIVVDDHDEAYGWGLKQFGIGGGFVIDQAVEHEPIPAWKLGGLGAAAVHEKQYAELQAKHDALAAENAQLLRDNKAFAVVLARLYDFCSCPTAIRACLVVNRREFDELVAALDALEVR